MEDSRIRCSSECGSGTPACLTATRHWSGNAMRIVAYAAVFNLFAVLDGSAIIGNPPHGQLRLTYVGPDRSEHPLNLNDRLSISAVDELHSLWTTEVISLHRTTEVISAK